MALFLAESSNQTSEETAMTLTECFQSLVGLQEMHNELVEWALTENYRCLNEGVGEFLEKVWEKVKAFAKTVWEKIKQIVRAVVEKAKQIFRWIKLNTVGGKVLHVKKGGIQTVRNTLKTLSALVYAVSKGIHSESDFGKVEQEITKARDDFTKASEVQIEWALFVLDPKCPAAGYEVMDYSEFEDCVKQTQKLAEQLEKGVEAKKSALDGLKVSDENKEKVQAIQKLLQADIFTAGGVARFQSKLATGIHLNPDSTYEKDRDERDARINKMHSDEMNRHQDMLDQLSGKKPIGGKPRDEFEDQLQKHTDDLLADYKKRHANDKKGNVIEGEARRVKE
jgi:hypothetical protein